MNQMAQEFTVCYGLRRMLGMAGFVVAGNVLFSIARTQFHIDVLAHASLNDLSQREILVGIAGVFAGLIGAVVGQVAGTFIPVRSTPISDLMDALWHFGVNNIMVWTPVMILLFGITID